MRTFLAAMAISQAAITLPSEGRTQAQEPAGPIKEALAHLSKGRFRPVLRILEENPSLLKEDPQGQYLASFAWMRLHRPEMAKPLATAASEKGYSGYPGWPSPQDLLARIAVIERLRPPPAKGVAKDERLKAIRVFADDTPWIQAVLDAMPRYAERAQEVFGKDLPTIDFYLFRSRENYNEFYKALFGLEIPTAWQNGTGNANVVTFCQANREGKPVTAPGAARGLGDVLHEYGHALLNTLYGDNYLRAVPQWLDEGLSDFLARDYYKELFETSADLVRKCATVPSVDELTRRLYERDPALRYAVARYMVDDLLKNRQPSLIRDILKRASPDGDFEKALLGATGVKASDLRENVIARFR